jgi:hypothetical protein
MVDNPDYSLYRLAMNPFCNFALDPLKVRGSDRQFVAAEGFPKDETLDNRLKSTVKQHKPKPAFFLVAGKSGSGRSSVANLILARYAAQLGVPGELLFIPKYDFNPKAEDSVQGLGRDSCDIFRAWFGDLQNLIDDAKIKLGDELEKLFSETLNNLTNQNMAYSLQRLAKRVAEALANLLDKATGTISTPAAYGLLFEDVPTVEIIEDAFLIFKGVPVTCVFTTRNYDKKVDGDDIIGKFLANPGPFQEVITLYPVGATEVSNVVHSRWKSACEVLDPLPFDPDEVGMVFGRPPRTIAQALSIMGELIGWKLRQQSGKSPWPDNDELRITRKQMEDIYPILERLYGS